MKDLQHFKYLGLFLLGLILIPGCNRTEAPLAPGETQHDAAKPLLFKNSGNGLASTSSDRFLIDSPSTASAQVSFFDDFEDGVLFDDWISGNSSWLLQNGEKPVNLTLTDLLAVCRLSQDPFQEVLKSHCLL